jgi:hypothetical protein
MIGAIIMSTSRVLGRTANARSLGKRHLVPRTKAARYFSCYVFCFLCSVFVFLRLYLSETSIQSGLHTTEAQVHCVPDFTLLTSIMHLKRGHPL